MLSDLPHITADAKRYHVGDLQHVIGPHANDILLVLVAICVVTLIWKFV